MALNKPFSRREFLKMSALVIGSSASLGAASNLISRLETEGQGGIHLETAQTEKIVPTICLLCSSGCGMLARVTDGNLVKLEGSNPPGLDKGDVIQYCESIRQSLKGLSADFETKRRVLTLLVNNIALEGKTVRIRGVIPAVPQQNGPETGGNPCHIASLTSGGCGRNTATAEFELVTSLS